MAKNYFVIPPRPKPRIQITSLMDVLTIILVFLLTNYSEEAPDPNIGKDISLPIIEAKSEKRNTSYSKDIKVSLGSNRLEIGDEIMSFKSFETQKTQILDVAVKKISSIVATLTPEQKTNSVITLHADKDIQYSMIEDLMKAAAAAGVTQVEMVALYEESKK